MNMYIYICIYIYIYHTSYIYIYTYIHIVNHNNNNYCLKEKNVHWFLPFLRVDRFSTLRGHEWLATSTHERGAYPKGLGSALGTLGDPRPYGIMMKQKYEIY